MKTVQNITAVVVMVIVSWILADMIASRLRRHNGIVEYRQEPALP